MKTASRRSLVPVIAGLLFAAFLLALVPTVNAHAGNITISKKSKTLFLKNPKKIKLHVYDDGAEVSAKWKSSNKKVATVNNKGLVTAKKTGKTTITAKVNGVTVKCRITVKTQSAKHKKAIAAYKKFLTRRYVVYTNSGDIDQADNFNCIDLDKDGIPELLTCVVSPWGDRYYVLYNFNDGKISSGQRLGVCSEFTWYSGRKVMGYRETQSDRSLYFYSKYNGVTLNSKAIVCSMGSSVRYYKSKGKIGSYGTQVSPIKFRNYVNQELLNYGGSTKLTMYVNTASNRNRYIK